MNKKLILIVCTLLLIAGCTGSPRDKAPITDVDIRKGLQGLTMEFTKNAPPERVFEDDIFPIAVRLRNQGASDINAIEVGHKDGDGAAKADNVNGVLVFGLEKTYVGLVGEEGKEGIIFNINGKSISNPNGDEEIITLNAQTKKIGAQSETQSSTILATACYPYKTILGASVCIDTDIYGERRGQKACSIADLKFTEGQGAPAAITKIETRMLPQDNNLVQPHFLILIENKGNGEVVSLSEVENACTGKALDYRAFNTVIIKASLSNKPLDCRINKDDPKPAVIRLRDK